MSHQVVCIGAMLVDELFYCKAPVVAGTSNPASAKRSAGGVMRNIVHHLTLLDIPVQFITVAGNDSDGNWLKEDCIQSGIDMSTTVTVDGSTGKYSAILHPDGSLYTAACVNECESFLTIELLQQQEKILSKATIIIADTNLDQSVLIWLIAYCKRKQILLFIDPVSVAKAKKLQQISLDGLYMVTPNEDELPSMVTTPSTPDNMMQELLGRGVNYAWLRKGAAGSQMVSANNIVALPSPSVEVKDITGAGDSALAAWVAAYTMGKTAYECLLAAHSMAAAILQVEGAIDRSMNPKKLFISIEEYYPDEY